MQTHIVKINQPVIGIQLKIKSLTDVSLPSIDLLKSHVFSNKQDDLSDQVMILENALQTSREESFQAGYEEGKEASVFEMNQKLEDMSEEFKAIVSSLRCEYDKALERMETPLVRLSIRIAEKILGTELNNKEKMAYFLSGKVRDMLMEIKEQSQITIHINNERMQWVNDQNIISELNIPDGVEINFVGDDQLQPGECLLETEEFIVDNTFQYQLETLEQQILEESMNGNIRTEI